MPDFQEALESGEVLLFDGAMGTEIYDRGVFINRCYDDLSRSSPEMILEIHRDYREAGARVLETNTFGANRFQLQSHGLEDEVEAVNRASAELARRVAGDELFVAGSMGPLGVRIEPYGPTSRAEARDAFREQAAALVAGGVDLLVLETFSDLDELLEAVRACREATDLPVVAHMTIQPDGATTYGQRPADIAVALEEAGVDAAGLNCSVGPALLVEAIREMAGACSLPLSALPNAGLPKEIQGRKMYLASPEYMASYARKLVEAGARIVGGCCGTTPDHVREMVRQLRSVREAERKGSSAIRASERERERPAAEPAALPDRSGLGRSLAEGRPLRTVALRPPRGADVAGLVAACRRLEEAGVDAVCLTDEARFGMRMSVVAAAATVLDETAIEPLVEYTCRDRNLLGMTADLLGAHALGVRNLVLVTGDPPRMGPYPEATAVFDVDAIGLTNVVERLNRGRDLGDNPLDSRTEFVKGVGVHTAASDMERELERWYWKVDAGADFGVTRPVFDPERLEAFVERIEARGTRVPLLASVWPVTGLRDAEYLHHEVPGVEVPPGLLRRMERAQEDGPEAARREGLEIAAEIAKAANRVVEGVQVTAPVDDPDAALRVVEALAPPRVEG
jgi:homocysteine S-methyltransferase